MGLAKLSRIKLKSNKLAAISAVWIIVIIGASLLLGESGLFVQMLPILCMGGFLSVAIEIYTDKLFEM